MSTKISDLTSAIAITTNDIVQVIDVDDFTMAPSGTNKKATASLLANQLVPLVNNAGIPGAKVNPSFGAQNISTSGTLSAGIGSLISGSGSADALRVTQGGSGNALVIEDVANPDNSPFVVDTNGSLKIGFNSNLDVTGYNGFEGLQLANVGTGTSSAAITMTRWSNDGGCATLSIGKSRGIGAPNRAVVQNNDLIGAISFIGDDGGTGDFVTGAQIRAAVDGTPGANDMPTRLQFLTTPDNSATPVEAMRISASGGIGVGTTAAAGRKLDVRGNATGATDISHVVSGGTVASDVTSEFKSFTSLPSTAASAFTLTILDHFRAGQGTLGAGSSVTSQSGFKAGNSIVGANLNHGFWGDIDQTLATISNISLTTNVVTITTSVSHGFTTNQRITVSSSVTAVNGTYTITSVPSGTTLTYAKTNADIPSAAATGTIESAGRWNFYADGTSPNYFRGDVGIGTNTPEAMLNVVESDPTATNDVVRITNTGVGNSLVVEDATNPDTTPFVINSGGSVAIGTATVNGSCLLQMTSTTKGFKPPSLTTTERNAIATPLAGVMVYNSTTNKLNFYNGTAWEQVTSA